jgi:hypothetical protein
MCGPKKSMTEQDGAKASVKFTEISYHPDTIVTTLLVSFGVVAVCVLAYFILHRMGFCGGSAGGSARPRRGVRFHFKRDEANPAVEGE